jgi:Notch-like protein
MTRTDTIGLKRLAAVTLGFALACTLALGCDDASCPMGSMEINARCVPKSDAGDENAAGASTVPPQGVIGEGTAAVSGSAANGVGAAGMSMTAASGAGTGALPAGSGVSGASPGSSAGAPGSPGSGSSAAGSGPAGGNAGSGSSMSGGVACTPAAEECDNIDNDCDGTIDESVAPMPCGNAMPPCRQGMKTCQNGVWSTECAGEVGPTKEVCDGIDNDCTGSADEGCACTDGETQPCGNSNPPCKQGKKTCVSGQWSATCEGEVKPGTETCDGVDNDCNGTPDDGGDRLCTGGNHCAGAQKCVACIDDGDCASSDQCKQAMCASGACRSTNKADHTGCQTGSIAGICSSGTCISGCINASDCNSAVGETCSGNQCIVPPRCGNGKLEGSEECDDGNSINTDNCTTSCKTARCGDGYKSEREACDPEATGSNKWNCDPETCFSRYVYTPCQTAAPNLSAECGNVGVCDARLCYPACTSTGVCTAITGETGVCIAGGCVITCDNGQTCPNQAQCRQPANENGRAACGNSN